MLPLCFREGVQTRRVPYEARRSLPGLPRREGRAGEAVPPAPSGVGTEEIKVGSFVGEAVADSFFHLPSKFLPFQVAECYVVMLFFLWGFVVFVFCFFSKGGFLCVWFFNISLKFYITV